MLMNTRLAATELGGRIHELSTVPSESSCQSVFAPGDLPRDDSRLGTSGGVNGVGVVATSVFLEDGAIPSITSKWASTTLGSYHSAQARTSTTPIYSVAMRRACERRAKHPNMVARLGGTGCKSVCPRRSNDVAS